MQPLTLGEVELSDDTCTRLSYGSFLFDFLFDLSLGMSSGSCTILIVSRQWMCYVGILKSLALLVSFAFLQSLLVVECDMPWKEGLEAKYGDSFHPWAEEDFQEAIGNITAALPHNHLTTIVSFVFLTLLSRRTIHLIKGLL